MEQFEFDVVKFNEEMQIYLDKGVDYLDAVITYCEKKDLEIETLVPILKKDPIIRAHLLEIAEKRNFLKKAKPENI